MSHQTNRFRRIPGFGVGTEPPLFESGDYTIPDPLDGRLTPLDDLAMLPAGDFEDNESTTITRRGFR
jgi:hypothetical protein